MLMSRGALLLGESGYRETDTTGPAGEWRADTYHNRLVVRRGLADPQTRLLPFLLDEGRYRFVQTHSLHFHQLRSVDVSRTRLTDGEMGYRWDRIIVYLKELDLFVLFDVVKVLEEGDYTFADLLYSGRVLQTTDGFCRVRLDSMGTICTLPNSEATDLLICYPECEGRRRGAEQVRRSHQNQVCVYQAASGHFAAGAHATFTTVLVPVGADQACEPVAASIQAIASEAGQPGVGVRIARDDGYVQVCAALDPEAAFLEENVRPRYSFESGRGKYGELETDASFTYLATAGSHLTYSLVEATRMVYAERELFAPPTIDMRQDDGTWMRPGMIRWRAWEGEATL